MGNSNSNSVAYECAETGKVAYFETVELSVLSNSLDSAGKSLLLTAAARGHLNSVQVICRRCPELLDKRSPMGVTALHEAAYNGQHDVVKFLIYAGGKMDHRQSFAQSREVVDSQLLMAVNVWKYTALHDAANRGHFESAKLLIDADVNKQLLGMVNIDNATAMDLAVKNNHPQIVKLLAQAEYSQDRSSHTAHYIALVVAVPVIQIDQLVKLRSFFELLSFLGLWRLPPLISRCVTSIGIFLRVGYVPSDQWDSWSSALAEKIGE